MTVKNMLFSPERRELWQLYMDEYGSDSTVSEIGDDSMAGPSSALKITKPEAIQAKKKLRKDSIKEVLDDSFNSMVHNILNGGSAEGIPAAVDDEISGKQNKSKSTTGKPNEASTVNNKASKNDATSSSLKEDATSTKTAHDATKRGNPGIDEVSGNQSSLSSLPICSSCSLPRLQYPRIGLNSRSPPDPNAYYCANEPAIVLAGHDVHGNAFPGFKPKHNNPTSAVPGPGAGSKTTKAKPSAKSAKGAAGPDAASSPPGSPQDSTGSDPGTGTATPSTANPNNNAAAAAAVATEYPSIKTPQMKCPNNCGQWKAVNVMAKHLDVCMLGKGRKAGREAREKMGRDAGGDSSRAGTPRPGNGGGGTTASGGVSGAGSKRKLDGEGGEKVGKKLKKGK